MENQTQNPINFQGAPNQNNSDFAQKQPLIDPRTLSLIKKLAIGLFSFLMIIIVSIIAYNAMPKGTPVAGVNSPVEDTDQPIVEEKKSFFAYIKDDKAIWIADINGENKQVIVEIPTSSAAVITTTTWKSPNQVTYAVCADQKSNCEIKTINIDDKSSVAEFSTQRTIKKIAWDKSAQYIAFIEDSPETSSSLDESSSKTSFMLKTGTIYTELAKFTKQEDPGNINTRVMFSSDNQYIVYYGINRKAIDNGPGQRKTIVVTPVISIYLLNGTKVDQIESAKDPFFITENKLGYIREGKIVYKTIGLEDETIATAFNGFTPQISPDKNLIAYWYAEGSLNNVVLGVFDTTLNIHRNILRGIVLPHWISNSQIIGIKADNCLGSSCQLYEFKTNSISLVDISRGNVVQIDQGRRISEPSYVFFEDKDAN